jgi:hypothetical protein
MLRRSGRTRLDLQKLKYQTLVHVMTTNLYLSFLSLLTIMPLLISIILGGT